MSNFIHKKSKILLLCLFVMLTLTACGTPRGKDGKTKLDQIISYQEITLQKDQINTTEITDEDVKKEIESQTGDTIVIKPTTWGDAWKNGWFDGLIVWPIAQLINVLASFTDAGWGIILATLLIQVLIYLLTYKSQLSQQKMQELQPELTRIQNKYAGKNDDRSRMLMMQEQQKLYSDNDIHPFGSLLVLFLQLPIMMGMFYATQRAITTVYGSFMGMPLSITPMEAFQQMSWGPIVVYVLMLIMSIVSVQLPKWLKDWDEKKEGKKKKKDKGGMMADSMNMVSYMTTAMVGFMYISWPIAMSFYWLVSSAIRSGTAVISHIILKKEAAKRALERRNSAGILKNRKK
ncbi:MAG: YidC/Oxa1 family membrane protein insertase [Erysipelotrichaceae bacterium]|nr:YidC/Oxa1 family membrane protein insertase [Erysipelotrichaceae bacterium]